MTSNVDLAVALVRAGRPDEARAIHDENSWVPAKLQELASQPSEVQAKQDFEEYVWYGEQRARLALVLELPEDAEVQAPAAVSALIRCSGHKSLMLARPLETLGDALAARDRSTEAVEVLRRALGITRACRYRTHPDVRRPERRLMELQSEMKTGTKGDTQRRRVTTLR